MDYFISENIFSFNSGTEHSQARRVQLFNAMPGHTAQYVTRNYNRFLARDRAGLGLEADQVLNMYDYFQGTTAVPRTEQALRLLPQIPLDTYKIEGQGPNYSLLEYAGRMIARIDVMPATVGLVNTITYYDRFDNPTVRENFDWRGFKSSVDYFHPGGAVARTVYLNLAGAPVLETVWMNIDGELHATMWKLLNYKGRNYRFNFEDQLFLFFLNELVAAHPGSTLISDRRNLDAAVGQVTGATAKWAYLHDAHALKGKLLSVYREVLVDHPNHFTGVMVATPEQQADIARDYPAVNAVVAPDTYTVVDTPAEAPARLPHRLLMVGRLAPEKRPDQALQIFAQVKKQVPDATFELRGYPSEPTYQEQLQNQVAKAGLTDSVIFSPYATDTALAESYLQASVVISTSEHEGLGMQLVDALGYGRPIVAYQTAYGATRIVANGENGYLAPEGNQRLMSQHIVALMNDDALWARMHQAALTKADDFSQAQASQAWQHLAVEPLGV